jgi:hypothetical protein
MVVVRTEKFFSHACNGLGNVKENVGDRSLVSRQARGMQSRLDREEQQ